MVLRDTLTKAERSLVADHRAQLVLDMREAYQSTMGHDLISGVEAISGRKVIAFLSDTSTPTSRSRASCWNQSSGSIPGRAHQPR